MDSRDYGFEGDRPDIHGNAHVSRESTLVGNVRVESNASVWPGAVLRGDVSPVHIGKGTHVTENVAVHASTIGKEGMVGLGSVVNDSEVGDNTLVGLNATINEATVGDHCVVATGAVIQQGTEVPPRSFVYGTPAKTQSIVETDLDVEGLYERYSTGGYANLAARYSELFDED